MPPTFNKEWWITDLANISSPPPLLLPPLPLTYQSCSHSFYNISVIFASCDSLKIVNNSYQAGEMYHYRQANNVPRQQRNVVLLSVDASCLFTSLKSNIPPFLFFQMLLLQMPFYQTLRFSVGRESTDESVWPGLHRPLPLYSIAVRSCAHCTPWSHFTLGAFLLNLQKNFGFSLDKMEGFHSVLLGWLVNTAS